MIHQQNAIDNRRHFSMLLREKRKAVMEMSSLQHDLLAVQADRRARRAEQAQNEAAAPQFENEANFTADAERFGKAPMPMPSKTATNLPSAPVN